MYEFIKALYRSRRLLAQLVVNDFKKKYAGNFLGLAWAFIQPIFNILILWFVFQVGFKSHAIQDVPFILWLMAGMIPWFFISEALNAGTNSIVSNDFLVKKVVFRVGLLPLIPLISSFIIHLFFVLFMLGMFVYYHFYPTVYWLQLLYYMFASFILLLGLSWLTSALTVYIRDVSQFVGMVIQFGFWLTPIFWSIEKVPEQYQWLIKLNPFFYIIEGYRNSVINHKWFWEDMTLTIYFWTVTLVFLVVGALTFKKLRPYFADVL